MSDSASRRKLARAAARLAAAASSDLPSLVLVTDDERLPDPIGAAKVLPKASAVIVRARDDRRRGDLAGAMRDVARARGLFLLIAGDLRLALALGADGVHLPEGRLGEAAAIRARHRMMVTAAAHSYAALRRTGFVDAVLLSPVFPTQSHPGRAALGAMRASAMARGARVPVYALGGVTTENAGQLSGFAGIAAIGGLAL